MGLPAVHRFYAAMALKDFDENEDRETVKSDASKQLEQKQLQSDARSARWRQHRMVLQITGSP